MASERISESVEDGDESQEDLLGTADHFHIHDDVTANWVVRKIVEGRSYAERCAEWCNREQNRARQQEEFLLFRFGQQVLNHARKRIAEQGGRRKCVNLPAGTIGFRQTPLKLLVDDEALVIEWAKRNKPELVSTVQCLSKSGLNQHLKETGEVPDVGVRVEPPQEKFYIK